MPKDLAFNIKPLPSQPCNKCGLCCLHRPCFIGGICGSKDKEPCKFLKQINPLQYECPFVLREKELGLSLIQDFLAIGMGCFEVTSKDVSIAGKQALDIGRDFQIKSARSALKFMKDRRLKAKEVKRYFLFYIKNKLKMDI